MGTYSPIAIESRQIGLEAPDVFLIAEVGNAHDGDYNVAHRFIDAFADTGAHAIKFQTHLADSESTPREQFRVNFSRIDATRMDYWRRMEFAPKQWQELKAHAEQKGLIFLSSPFSPEAVDLLEGLGVAAWKVGSGETNNLPMIRQMARTGKPVLISSGMSYLSELDSAVEACRAEGCPHMVFHCTSAYPCPPQQAGLRWVPDLAQRYGCPVGYSDHSGDVVAGIAAAAVGASAVEVHVCLGKDSFGPDTPASLTSEGLRRLAAGLADVRKMLLPLEKDEMARRMEPMRKMFCKSLVYRTDLPAGTVLAEKHLTGKKPGDGVPVARLDEYVGRRLVRAVVADEQLCDKDVQ